MSTTVRLIPLLLLIVILFISFEFVDSKITGEPKWLEVAKKEKGVRERNGKRNEPRILTYHNSTLLRAKSDETPWCSAFVNWCLSTAGYKGTNSAVARSWLNWGIDTTLTKGCIAIFSRADNPMSTWQGHVGFVMGKKGDNIVVLGGNQDDEVNESLYPRKSLLGCRWPSKNQNFTHGDWYVILGSFKNDTKNGVNRQLNYIWDKGYVEAYVMNTDHYFGMTKGLYIVSIGPLNKAKAIRIKNEIRRKTTVKDAYCKQAQKL